MAGLNCGLASRSLPTVAATFDAFVAVDDDDTAAMRLLADAGLDVGETGAAAGGPAGGSPRPLDALPIPEAATVLLLATEGVTDPENFARIVGRPPAP